MSDEELTNRHIIDDTEQNTPQLTRYLTRISSYKNTEIAGFLLFFDTNWTFFFLTIEIKRRKTAAKMMLVQLRSLMQTRGEEKLEARKYKQRS